MERYVVRYSPNAIEDLQSAFDWGNEHWGRDNALTWVVKFEAHIGERLSYSPVACSLAPESAERPLDIRHLVIQRYRILFTIEETTGYILRIRGPFSGQDLEIDRTDAA
jgi:plasmid stabilization system protein ParE